MALHYGMAFSETPCHLDECGRVRHLLARLRLVKHRTRTVTFAQLQVEINQRMNERLEALGGWSRSARGGEPADV